MTEHDFEWGEIYRRLSEKQKADTREAFAVLVRDARVSVLAKNDLDNCKTDESATQFDELLIRAGINEQDARDLRCGLAHALVATSAIDAAERFREKRNPIDAWHTICLCGSIEWPYPIEIVHFIGGVAAGMLRVAERHDRDSLAEELLAVLGFASRKDLKKIGTDLRNGMIQTARRMLNSSLKKSPSSDFTPSDC